MIKVCRKCKKVFPPEMFYKDKSYSGGFRSECKKCHIEYQNTDKYKQYRKEYEKSESCKKIRNEYRQRPERKIASRKWLLEYNKTYKRSQDSKNHVNEYVKSRKKQDVCFKISVSLRDRLNKAIKSNQRSGSAITDLGCSVSELKLYLEKQFKAGMTWENHSVHGWHIDHIVPLATFNLSDYQQFKVAVHYTNLQPLWSRENISKGNKFV